MKKVLVLGVGAQGSAAAKRLDNEPIVSEIICADYDPKAVDNIVGQLRKAKGAIVDAHDLDSIVKAAEGVDLILNGLPLECTQNVLDAALIVKSNYQDYAGTTALDQMWVESDLFDPENEPAFEDEATLGWWRSINAMYHIYGPKFKEIGKLALFGTGSAPGLICAATKYAMRYLDKCDTIYNFVWEGAIAKRFQPFWWSPVTALTDMSEMALAFEGGKLINTPAFGRPITRHFPEMPTQITFKEHCHDEPLQYSFNAQVEDFAMKHLLEPELRQIMLLFLEELFDTFFLPKFHKFTFAIGVTERREVEMRFVYPGKALDPMTDEEGLLVRGIFEKNFSSVHYSRVGDENILDLVARRDLKLTPLS